MRTTISGRFAWAGWFTVGLTLLFALAGCGGGTASQLVAPNPNGVACANGTVASYLGTSCTQLPAVFQWTSYSCTSTPSSICAALGPNGSNVTIRLDSSGPHTLLVGASGLWNVTAGQSVDVVITGSVYAATTNNNWPHFNNLLGQTGDGTEDNITTVFCSSNCIALQGVSEIPCSNTSPVAYCTDQATIGPYVSQTAKFNATSSGNPYVFTIEIKLDGGIGGTATLHSVGIHLS